MVLNNNSVKKYYDEMGFPYKKENEIRDKSGKVTSITIIQRPGENEVRNVFFRELDSCKKDYAKTKKELDKLLQPQKDAEKKKYGDYE